MSNIFLVGANFGKDVSKDFIKKGKWELGWKGNENNKQYRSMLRIFNQVNVGDDLVIKSTYTRKNGLPFDNHGKFVSVMKIKAIGKVTKLVGDGHTLLVDWDKSFKDYELWQAMQIPVNAGSKYLGTAFDLFANTSSEEKDDRLSKALDTINTKYGRGTIFHLAEGVKKPWQMRRDMLTPNYTTSWSQIPLVK